MIKLEPVQMQHTYEVGDESGYKFTIYASKDNEFHSWSASVTIVNWGFTTPEAAVESLAPALQKLLEQISDRGTFLCDDPNCYLAHCSKCRQPIGAKPHTCNQELTPKT